MFVPFTDPYEVFLGKTDKRWLMLGLQTGADIEDVPKVVITNIENGKIRVVELDAVRICPEVFDVEEEEEEESLPGDEWKDPKPPKED